MKPWTVPGSWSLGGLTWAFECRCRPNSHNVIPMDWAKSRCSKCGVTGQRPPGQKRNDGRR